MIGEKTGLSHADPHPRPHHATTLREYHFQRTVGRCPGEGFEENEEGLSQNNGGGKAYAAVGVMNDLGCALQQVIADES